MTTKLTGEDGSSQVARVSLIIPCLNEARGMRRILPAIPDVVDEVIIVDKQSTDETIEVATWLRPTGLPPVFLTSLLRGAPALEGCRHAKEIPEGVQGRRGPGGPQRHVHP